MLIIIEGPDGAGKSTFVKTLRSVIKLQTPGHKVTVHHAKPPKAHPLDEYVTPLVSYRPERGQTIICDRWHWGEWIYPSIFQRPTQFDTAVSRYTELFLLSRGAVVVFIDTDPSVIRTRLTVRGDNMVLPEQADTLVRRYRNVHRTLTQLPVFRVRPEAKPHIAASAIVNFASRHELHARRLNGFVTYVGSPNPRYLLVGERRNVVENHQPPAFMPFPATSGHFLLSHYRSLVSDNKIGLMNACDVDDPLRAWVDLDRPITVALGKEACARLCANGIPHGVAPHPQFVRRFHHREGMYYRHMINDALYGQIDLSRWVDGTSD